MTKTNLNIRRYPSMIGLPLAKIPRSATLPTDQHTYPKLRQYLRQIQHPDADDPYFKASYLDPLMHNPTQCLPLKDGIQRAGHQPNLDPRLCTHTSLLPPQQTPEGKWTGDNIPARFMIENDQYPRFFVSLVADWSRPQGGVIHSIQECLRTEDLVHVYLDLDSDSTPITPTDVDTIVTTFLGVINQYFQTSHILKHPEIVIVRNQGNSQHKVHVHIPELTLRKGDLKYAVEKVKGILPLLSEFIDTNYSGCRMVLTKKKADRCSMYYNPESPPWGGANPEEQLLLLLKTKVRAWTGEVPLEPRPEYKSLFTKDEDEQIESPDVVTTELQHRMASYIPADGQFEARWEDWGYNLKRRAPGPCPVCPGCIHESDNAKIKLDKGSIVYWCWRASRPVVMEKFRGPTDREKEIHQRIRMRKLQRLLKFDPPYYIKTETYNAPYLRPFDLDRAVQVAWSPMDTGKTYQVCQFIKDALLAGKIKSLAFLSTRCKFAQAIEGTLQRAEIPHVVNYLNNKVQDEPFIIISTESLHQTTRAYDLVIIDESTSCLTQMNSGLHKENLNLNRLCFRDLVRDAKYVIGMDADIDDRIMTFIHQIRPNDAIYLQHNTIKKRVGWKIKHWALEADWYQQIRLALQSGKNIAIANGSSELGVKYLMHFLINECGIPEEQIRFYHGKGDDYPEELRDVNSSWTQFRVLMYTSTINVGVDFIKEHYDVMFVYLTNQSVHAREMKQMMGRVRKLRDRLVHVLSGGKPSYAPTSCKEIRQDLVNSIAICNDEVKNRKLSHIKRTYLSEFNTTRVRVEEKYVYYLENTIWTWLTIQNIRERNLSLVYQNAMFRLLMEEQGFEYEQCLGSLTLGLPVVSAMVKSHNSWKAERRAEHDDEKEALYDEILKMNLSKEQLNEVEKRKIGGCASEIDKEILKVGGVMANTKPECLPNVTGKQVRDVKPQWTRNAQILRDWKDEDAVRNDMKKQATGRHAGWDLEKKTCLQDLSRLLGVDLLTNRTTEIPDTVIKDQLPKWIELQPKIKAAFGIRFKHGVPSTFKAIRDMIDAALHNSLGLRLKVFNKTQIRTNGKREWKFIYKLDASLEVDTALSDARCISPPKQTPSPVEVSPTAMNTELLTLLTNPNT